ncbi:MAG: type II secretion system ATPase GspE [Deltaproteobacteria bacterium]|nr:type II secretion system ATPase GspE [Deltaproteobacteria bacterium]
MVDEEELLRLISDTLGYPYRPELETTLDRSHVADISLGYLKRNLLAPLSIHDGVLSVATSDPGNVLSVDDLAHNLGCNRVEVQLGPRREVLKVIHGLMHQDEESTRQFVEDLDDRTEGAKILEELGQVEDLLDSTSEAPVIRLVNMLFTEAVKRRASDIHIEPYQNDFKVRYRVDGMLYESLELPRRLHSSVISRLKVLADLNIAEKRLPQDGRIQIRMGDREIDIRVSVIPTLFGERAVLRLLDKKGAVLRLAELGFSPEAYDTFERLIRKAHGIILVTGPTGSGKTTTLYAALSRINTREKNIITVEDPIEYQLPGIGQIQVVPKIGLTFGAGLRSILRHDPDVIMIGEIRDFETAEIAIQASLTGHLVFSTLHTNDSASAMTRLCDMGIEPFLITSSVVGVMAQRLVRNICPHCKSTDQPTPELRRELGLSDSKGGNLEVYRGKGCEGCFNTGYYGRTCINEILVLDDSLRRLVLRGSDATEIKQQAVSNGMITLRQDGIRKVLRGVTTVEEVLRVTQD